MRESNSTGNDPRQPLTAKPYVPQPISSQDLPVDYAGFLAVVLGVIGVMFRIDDEDSFEMISNNKHYPKLQHVPKIISKRQFLRAY